MMDSHYTLSVTALFGSVVKMNYWLKKKKANFSLARSLLRTEIWHHQLNFRLDTEIEFEDLLFL